LDITVQDRTTQHKTEQYKTNFYSIEFYFFLYDFWGTKCYFGILNNLYVGQKILLWFTEGQNYQFLSCPLPPVCHVPETIIEIKHKTTEVVLSCPLFFSKSNTPRLQKFLNHGLLLFVINVMIDLIFMVSKPLCIYYFLVGAYI